MTEDPKAPHELKLDFKLREPFTVTIERDPAHRYMAVSTTTGVVEQCNDPRFVGCTVEMRVMLTPSLDGKSVKQTPLGCVFRDCPKQDEENQDAVQDLEVPDPGRPDLLPGDAGRVEGADDRRQGRGALPLGDGQPGPEEEPV